MLSGVGRRFRQLLSRCPHGLLRVPRARASAGTTISLQEHLGSQPVSLASSRTPCPVLSCKAQVRAPAAGGNNGLSPLPRSNPGGRPGTIPVFQVKKLRLERQVIYTSGSVTSQSVVTAAPSCPSVPHALPSLRHTELAGPWRSRARISACFEAPQKGSFQVFMSASGGCHPSESGEGVCWEKRLFVGL